MIRIYIHILYTCEKSGNKCEKSEVCLEATRYRPESTVQKTQHRYPSFLNRGHTMFCAGVPAPPPDTPNHPTEQKHLDKVNS